MANGYILVLHICRRTQDMRAHDATCQTELRCSDTHLLARRALPCMADLRACMPTQQLPPTYAPAAELVLAAALLHDCLAAEAAGID
jgi:hypothetical protein